MNNNETTSKENLFDVLNLLEDLNITEKLCVLRKYMKDERELETGLEALLQTLYEKHVPAEVRETIDQKAEGGTL